MTADYELSPGKLKRARKRRLMTQLELGRAARLGENTVPRLERGEHTPYPSTIRKLAAALGVEPEEILGGSE